MSIIGSVSVNHVIHLFFKIKLIKFEFFYFSLEKCEIYTLCSLIDHFPVVRMSSNMPMLLYFLFVKTKNEHAESWTCRTMNIANYKFEIFFKLNNFQANFSRGDDLRKNSLIKLNFFKYYLENLFRKRAFSVHFLTIIGNVKLSVKPCRKSVWKTVRKTFSQKL